MQGSQARRPSLPAGSQEALLLELDKICSLRLEILDGSLDEEETTIMDQASKSAAPCAMAQARADRKRVASPVMEPVSKRGDPNRRKRFVESEEFSNMLGTKVQRLTDFFWQIDQSHSGCAHGV